MHNSQMFNFQQLFGDIVFFSSSTQICTVHTDEKTRAGARHPAHGGDMVKALNQKCIKSTHFWISDFGRKKSEEICVCF